MALLNERPANRTHGCLLRRAGKKGEPVFRVYKHSKEYRVKQSRKRERGEIYDKNTWVFKDYKITHYDVDIIIDDKSAAFYDDENGESVLDYSVAAMQPVPVPRDEMEKVISRKRGKKK